MRESEAGHIYREGLNHMSVISQQAGRGHLHVKPVGSTRATISRPVVATPFTRIKYAKCLPELLVI
jgi:hypothetical protein